MFDVIKSFTIVAPLKGQTQAYSSRDSSTEWIFDYNTQGEVTVNGIENIDGEKYKGKLCVLYSDTLTNKIIDAKEVSQSNNKTSFNLSNNGKISLIASFYSCESFIDKLTSIIQTNALALLEKNIIVLPIYNEGNDSESTRLILIKGHTTDLGEEWKVNDPPYYISKNTTTSTTQIPLTIVNLDKKPNLWNTLLFLVNGDKIEQCIPFTKDSPSSTMLIPYNNNYQTLILNLVSTYKNCEYFTSSKGFDIDYNDNKGMLEIQDDIRLYLSRVIQFQ